MRYSTKLLRTTLAASLMLAAIAGIVSLPSRHLAFLSMNAFAQEDQFKAITFLTGECRFQLVQGFFPCQKTVMWSEAKNGRTAVSFFKDDVAFGLSGGRDRQPNPENYYLSVDTVRVTPKGKPDETGEVEGECHFRLNRSASKFYFIRCDVYNRKVGFAWNFYLDSIESFDRKTFASPKAQPNAPGVSSAQGSSQRPSSRVEVPLKKEGGTFVVPVQINGAIALDFTVDSGAADVSVPADVFSTLTRTGTIRDTDIIGEQTYVLADGSEAKSTTFTIRSLKVGNKIVENVKGRIAPPNGSLLLGQSFLERFKSWSIDNTKHVLVLEPQTPSMTPTQITEAQKLGLKEPTKPARGDSLPENSTGASAKNADILRAMGELAGELQICSTYFTVVSVCVKDQRADLANTYSAAAEKVGILAINTGRAAGVADEAYAAQATLYTDAMMKAMGKNCTNIAVLLQKYVDFCQRLNKDADSRLMEWIACAHAGREDNCDGPGLPDPARNVK